MLLNSKGLESLKSYAPGVILNSLGSQRGQLQTWERPMELLLDLPGNPLEDPKMQPLPAGLLGHQLGVPSLNNMYP